MRERILQISKEQGLSHIGSCLGAAQVLEEIYQIKRPEDIVIMDEGHAHLAHLVAEEKYNGKEIKLPLHDIHCNKEDGCYVSSGSLGLAGAIALGIALADREKDVYVLTSDGALAEGIWWETLRVKVEQKADNMKVYVNANGYSGLGSVDVDWLERRLHAFDPSVRVIRTVSDFGEITGVSAHYSKI